MQAGATGEEKHGPDRRQGYRGADQAADPHLDRGAPVQGRRRADGRLHAELRFVRPGAAAAPWRRRLPRGAAAVVASFASPIVCTVSQLEITSAGGIAFSRSLNRVSGRKTSGEEVDLWVRATICYRRIGGEWRVAHEARLGPLLHGRELQGGRG
ncbi:MAG: YybH family protein, partial [Allosphingosinicella sp.]